MMELDGMHVSCSQYPFLFLSFPLKDMFLFLSIL